MDRIERKRRSKDLQSLRERRKKENSHKQPHREKKQRKIIKNHPKIVQNLSKTDQNWSKNRSRRRLGSDFASKVEFWSILDPKMVQNWSKNRPKLVQKSIQKDSWKRLRIQTHFLIDFGCDFDRFLIPKSIKNLSKMEICIRLRFLIDFWFKNSRYRSFRES